MLPLANCIFFFPLNKITSASTTTTSVIFTNYTTEYQNPQKQRGSKFLYYWNEYMKKYWMLQIKWKEINHIPLTVSNTPGNCFGRTNKKYIPIPLARKTKLINVILTFWITGTTAKTKLIKKKRMVNTSGNLIAPKWKIFIISKMKTKILY